jgi:uncharacterized protein YkwD
VAAAAALSLVFPGAAAARVAPEATPVPSLESGLVAKINTLRARHGLRRLTESGRLERAARAYAQKLLGGGYFEHGDIRRRLAGLSAVGENLAWHSGTPTAGHTVALWLASPPHRRNLLSPVWRRVGIGAVHGPASGGVYGHGPVTVIVADFGAP